MFAEINGIRLHYELTGEGPTLVFLHGIGMGLRQWDEQVKYFSSQYQCLTVDIRGHKLSSAGNMSIGNMAADVLALLDKLGIDKFHLIGYSMGGMVAQEIYKQQRKRILSLVLSSTTCLTKVPGWEILLTEKLKFIDAFSMTEIGPMLAAACCPPEFSQLNPQAYQSFVQMLQEHSKEVYRETTVETSSLDYRELLKEVNIPVLILVGELDKVCPLAASQLIKELIPQAKLQILPGTGHLALFEKTEEYNLAINEFLSIS